jgi:hypothetical protein
MPRQGNALGVDHLWRMVPSRIVPVCAMYTPMLRNADLFEAHELACRA